MGLGPIHRAGWANRGKLILILLATSLSFSQSLAGKGRRSRSPQDVTQSTLKITVRVYNYANVPNQLLERAEKEASTIFRQTAIEVEWVDCPLTERDMQFYPACRPDLGAADFVVNLLPERMAQRAALRDTTFGFAQISPDHARSYVASVFWDRITEATRTGDLSAYQLLGHAIAHEIGHLLFGSVGHARTGLMSASWGPPELKVMARGYLAFTPRQGERMRTETLARVRQEQLWAHRVELAGRAHQDRRGEYEASNRR